jgi:hypothetical protein
MWANSPPPAIVSIVNLHPSIGYFLALVYENLALP